MAAPVSIGLDVGSVAVRAVEVSHGKGRPMIDTFGHVPLAHGAMAGGVVKDDRAVTAAVKALWSSHKFSSRSVRLGVSHQQVVVREVEIANLPPKQQRLALPHLVRDALPLPVEQAILSFHPLEQPDKRDTVRGLLVAAPKEAVLDTVHAVERAGLHVGGVDLACFAVLRAVATDTASTSGAEAIVDIGAGGTLLVIHQDGLPQIVRTIPRGGDEITRVLATRLNLSTADAEALKCSFTATPAGDLQREGAEALDDAIRPLLSEIRSSLNFYVNSGAGRTVDRVTLVGRASQVPGLAAQLRRITDLPVAAGDPLQYVGSARHSNRREDLHLFRAAAAVSVGLTLGVAS